MAEKTELDLSWTLDKHLQEVIDEIEPLHKAQDEIYKTEKGLMLDVAQTLLQESFGAVYENLVDRISNLKEEIVVLEGNSDNAKNGWVRNDIEKSVERIYDKIFDAKRKTKIPFLVGLQEFSQAKKLPIAYALDLGKLVGFSCNGSFNHYKTPTKCGRCIEAYKNLQLTDLTSFFKPEEGRIYRSDWKEIIGLLPDSIGYVKDKEKKDGYIERHMQYDKLERPDKEQIETLGEKRKLLQRFKDEEGRKIDGVLRSFKYKLKKRIDPCLE